LNVRGRIILAWLRIATQLCFSDRRATTITSIPITNESLCWRYTVSYLTCKTIWFRGLPLNKSMLLIISSLLEASTRKSWYLLLRCMVAIAICVPFISSNLLGQEKGPDAEAYKLKIGGEFWYATPTATLAGSSAQVPISFDNTLGFQTYSTFSSGLDWHFKRKHHLLFIVSPNQTTHTTVLNQTITFKNLTFEAGSSVSSTLRTYSYAPGYRYDIVHRRRGHLGIDAQINLLDIKATITGIALQSSGQTSASASGSVFAPLPVFGPEGRAYFAKNRLYIDGTLKGMYFFGYGNFISTGGTVGVSMSRHVDFVAGYQMGSHLAINGTTDRVSVRLTQRGPTAGLTFTF
jgi:hypothetical protein